MANSHIFVGSAHTGHYPAVRHIGVAEIREALAEGFTDFMAMPSHLVFLGLIYPIVGIWLVVGYAPPLIFPLLSGFALIGPFAAIGLYEMSRRRELGLDVSWRHAFDVVRSHAIFPIVSLGLLLLVIFALWEFTAQALYGALLGPTRPQTLPEFLSEVFSTTQGWQLIGLGTAAGFLFAIVAFCISVTSFPMLVDRDVSVPIAIQTSVRSVLENPLPMALWGLIVAVSLAGGILLVFAGLAVVVPVLAHATWHLYRKVVEPEGNR